MVLLFPVCTVRCGLERQRERHHLPVRDSLRVRASLGGLGRSVRVQEENISTSICIYLYIF